MGGVQLLLVFAISCLYIGHISGSGCIGKTDFKDWYLYKPYCREKCKKMGVKVADAYADRYPTDFYGIYDNFGNHHARTRYTKYMPGTKPNERWTLSWDCLEDKDTEAWTISKGGTWNSAIFYSGYQTVCPSDDDNQWWYKKDGVWGTTGGRRRPHLIVECNPRNEDDFKPPPKNEDDFKPPPKKTDGKVPSSAGANFMSAVFVMLPTVILKGLF